MWTLAYLFLANELGPLDDNPPMTTLMTPTIGLLSMVRDLLDLASPAFTHFFGCFLVHLLVSSLDVVYVPIVFVATLITIVLLLELFPPWSCLQMKFFKCLW